MSEHSLKIQVMKIEIFARIKIIDPLFHKLIH